MKLRNDFVTNSSSSSYLVTICFRLKNGKTIAYEGGIGEEGGATPEDPVSPRRLANFETIDELLKMIETYSELEDDEYWGDSINGNWVRAHSLDSFKNHIEKEIRTPQDIVSVSVDSEGTDANNMQWMNERYDYDCSGDTLVGELSSSTGEETIDCGDDMLRRQFYFDDVDEMKYEEPDND